MIVPISINLGRVPQLPNGRHVIAGGTQIYILNGQKHRENGPAEISTTGYKAWFWHGERHRKDGPAVVYADSSVEYWERGKFLRRELSDDRRRGTAKGK